MDWNWFYSSAAQSIAAIVGIFAAFVITKIVNNQTLFARNLLEIRNQINISQRLVERANQTCFLLYNINVRHRQFSVLKAQLEKETNYQSPNDYFNQLHFSRYDSKQKIMSEIEAMIKNFKDGANRSLINYGTVSLDDINKEEEEIDSLLADVQQNTRTISILIDSIEGNPECSSLITFAIICTVVLFFAGVICPLSLLPFDNTNTVMFTISDLQNNLWSFKGIILVLVSIIFSSIMMIFLVVNLHLRYNPNVVQQVRSFTQLSTYSEYLRNMEEN